MNPYLHDTEYAVKGLLDLAMGGEHELQRLTRGLRSAEAGFAMNYMNFSTIDGSDDFTDAHINAAYGRAMKSHEHVQTFSADIDKLTAELIDRDTALQALCGAVLQIAKQGIAVCHGDYKVAPAGRLVNPSSLTLPTLIWQGRNQAMHYESGTFDKPVRECFATLAEHFGPRFDLSKHQGRSRAREVVSLLGWTDYTAYLKDMWTLLP